MFVTASSALRRRGAIAGSDGGGIRCVCLKSSALVESSMGRGAPDLLAEVDVDSSRHNALDGVRVRESMVDGKDKQVSDSFVGKTHRTYRPETPVHTLRP